MQILITIDFMHAGNKGKVLRECLIWDMKKFTYDNIFHLLKKRLFLIKPAIKSWSGVLNVDSIC